MGDPGEKLKKRTKNSQPTYGTKPELRLGYTGRRQTPSPMHHLCSLFPDVSIILDKISTFTQHCFNSFS